MLGTAGVLWVDFIILMGERFAVLFNRQKGCIDLIFLC